MTTLVPHTTSASCSVKGRLLTVLPHTPPLCRNHSRRPPTNPSRDRHVDAGRASSATGSRQEVSCQPVHDLVVCLSPSSWYGAQDVADVVNRFSLPS